jgi:hypothetical protein
VAFKKVKNIFILLGLFLTIQSVEAQRKSVDNLIHFDNRTLHFGFYLGMNAMDYRISHYDNVYENPVLQEPENQWVLETAESEGYYQNTSYRVEVSPISPGLTVGGVVNYRINDNLDLRFTPGMSLGSRHLVFTIPISESLISQIENADQKSYTTIPSAYVDIPLGFRYKGWRHHNLRPYIYLGGAYRRDLENKRISEGAIHVARNGAYAEMGLGLDTYLEFFRFSAELRFSYGLNNIINHDVDPEKVYNTPYYGFIIKELNSNIFTLIFYFE